MASIVPAYAGRQRTGAPDSMPLPRTASGGGGSAVTPTAPRQAVSGGPPSRWCGACWRACWRSRPRSPACPAGRPRCCAARGATWRPAMRRTCTRPSRPTATWRAPQALRLACMAGCALSGCCAAWASRVALLPRSAPRRFCLEAGPCGLRAHACQRAGQPPCAAPCPLVLVLAIPGRAATGSEEDLQVSHALERIAAYLAAGAGRLLCAAKLEKLRAGGQCTACASARGAPAGGAGRRPHAPGRGEGVLARARARRGPRL